MGNHWYINHTESPEWYWVKSQVNVYIWKRKDQALRKKKKHNEHLEGLINKVGSMPSNTVSRKPNEESYQYNRGRKHSQLFPTWLKKVKS